MEPLTGVMRTIDLPDACPTCGVAPEDGVWPTLKATAYDASGNVTDEIACGPILLVPCGHLNEAPDAD